AEGYGTEGHARLPMSGSGEGGDRDGAAAVRRHLADGGRPDAVGDRDDVGHAQQVGRTVEVAGAGDRGERVVRRAVVPEREAVGIGDHAEVLRAEGHWCFLSTKAVVPDLIRDPRLRGRACEGGAEK